jgi:hypothetical protein
MGRDIRINPNLNATASSLYPEIIFSGLSASNIKLKVNDDGSIVFDGDTGGLFSIIDDKDGLLHSVNDVSGLPIFEVYSDNMIKMGKWDDLAMTIATSSVGIGTGTPSTNLHVEGGFRYVDGNQANGYILTSDDNGVAYWTQSQLGNVIITSALTDQTLRYDGSSWVNQSDLNISSTGEVGIGTSSNPSYSLIVNGDVNIDGTASIQGKFKLNDGTESNGYILVSDANGVASWENPTYSVGTGSIDKITRWSGVTSITDSGVTLNDSDDISGVNILTVNDSVGIGLTAPDTMLHISHTGATGSTVLKIDGVSGELFTVSDSLVGSLFSVNNISGLPIVEVFSDDTMLFGNYQAPSLNTTKKVNLVSGTNSIYEFDKSIYSGAFIDYTVYDSSNIRSGSITSTWLGTFSSFDELVSGDIGNTTGVIVSINSLSVTYSVFEVNVPTTGWVLKTIIRSI